MVRTVVVADRAARQLRRMPRWVSDKLLSWVAAVEMVGVEEVRKIPGFHDKPLRGKRWGDRAIRLSRSYRAIHRCEGAGIAVFLRVEEVTKHVY